MKRTTTQRIDDLEKLVLEQQQDIFVLRRDKQRRQERLTFISPLMILLGGAAVASLALYGAWELLLR